MLTASQQYEITPQQSPGINKLLRLFRFLCLYSFVNSLSINLIFRPCSKCAWSFLNFEKKFVFVTKIRRQIECLSLTFLFRILQAWKTKRKKTESVNFTFLQFSSFLMVYQVYPLVFTCVSLYLNFCIARDHQQFFSES